VTGVYATFRVEKVREMLGFIIKPIIKKYLRNMMKDFIQPILDFVTGVVNKWGMKSIVALGGIYALYDLSIKGVVTGIPIVIGIVAIVVGYFIFRHIQEVNQYDVEEEEEEEK